MLLRIFDYNQSTVLLYITLVVLSSLLAALSQRPRIENNPLSVGKQRLFIVRRKAFYFLSFLVLAFFSSFTSVGADRESYSYFFSVSTFSNFKTGIEPGFQFMMSFVHLFTNDARIFLGIISTLTIFNVFAGLWHFRKRIPLGFAIFIFSSQYYLQSYNLIRMYYAISITILFAYLIEEKPFKYLLCIALAATIHYSLIFVAIAYFLSIILRKYIKGNFGIRFVILSILVVVVVVFFGDRLTSILNLSSTLSSKYSAYLSNRYSPDYGVRWIVQIIPYLICIILSKYTNEETKIKYISFSYMLMAMTVSLLNYSIPVLGRAYYCLNLPIVVFLPIVLQYAIYYKKTNQQNKVAVRIGNISVLLSLNVIIAFVIVYFSIFFLLYLAEYIPSDRIDNYRFYWSK